MSPQSPQRSNLERQNVLNAHNQNFATFKLNQQQNTYLTLNIKTEPHTHTSPIPNTLQQHFHLSLIKFCLTKTIRSISATNTELINSWPFG